MNRIMKGLIKRMLEKDIEFRNNHMASALSALPIIHKIYKTFDFENDVFILSKGHACLAQYAVMELYGIKPDWSKLHPDIGDEGIDVTTGSLGHGLNLAIGIAKGKLIQGGKGIVHCLMGDGECQEGSVWEGLLINSDWLLSNLRVYVDANGYQALQKEMRSTPDKIKKIFPWVKVVQTKRWEGIKLFKDNPSWTVKCITEKDYLKILEELNA